ncbi:MAG: septum formation protein Maf [Paludibacteraceae bacterium]|nr:septum formation protein Maf [Paludibacteraceae bacterium]
MQIILGSQSPRRRELMAGLGVSFSAVSIDADESFPADLQAGDIPMYISRAKARAYTGNLKAGQLLVTADTIVWCDGRMLGKPQNAKEAQEMLRLLSGKTHQVYTAVTFAECDGRMDTVVDKTDVAFRPLTEEEIDYYITTCHPFDKAGAYGIQEWIGYVGCIRLNGSYFNVMGFPTHIVYQELKKRYIL